MRRLPACMMLVLTLLCDVQPGAAREAADYGAAQDERGADSGPVGAQGLLWQQTLETLPWQHIVIFRKP